MPFHRLRLAALAFAACLFVPDLAAQGAPEPEPEPETAAPPKTGIAMDPRSSHWGVGLGYVFNRLPISLSTFEVFLSHFWYSHVFGDPSASTRVAGTFGLYGFQVLLPVPRASVDVYLGRPTRDFQFKAGLGGFYDIAVGGHGGLSLEAAAIIRNRVEVSFLAVPVGTDSKRSYAEFLGIKSQEDADLDYKKAGNRWVEMPYFGILLGLRL